MKTKFTWAGIVATLIVIVGTFFVSCNKDDVNDVVNYRGQVVYLNTTTPFPDLTVKVTDGKNTHCQTQTDAGGAFALTVRVNEIDGNYYLLAGDSTCVPKKVALGAYGQSDVDLGVIEVEGPALPTVVTNPVQAVTANSATLGGEVQTDGRLMVTARGVCYGENPYPTVDGLHTNDGTGLGAFTSNLKELKFKTVYYARAYATNSKGTAYGEQVKFITEEGVAIVVTDSVYRVTVHTARCKGHVVSDGGFAVTQRGTCWSQYPDPTLDDDFSSDGSGLGEFTSALSNLQENTKYFVRTYATNSTTTSYGEQIIITTLDGLATVKTTNATATATSMVISCEVTDDAGYSVSERGICYSTINSEPSIDDSKKANGKGKGSYSVSVSELSASTTYYVRAYAINEYGVAYSGVINVLTKNGVSTVTIGSATNITDKTASCSVKVTDTGGSMLQTCGICWSTTQNPTIENSTSEGGNVLNTEYLCNMTNLSPSTKYYVRAYATTDITTSYSTQISFQTISGLPSVTTSTTEATSSIITSGGNITSDGGYTITERGVCYSSTNSNPTIDDSYVTSGVIADNFSVTITNVSVSTTYYVRAYAKNNVGIAYGDIKMVATGDGLPSVITTDAGENIKQTTIITGGQVISDGGYPILERGVCWSTLPYPTINDSKTSDGTGTGFYSSVITGIDLKNETYYIRAYATNINGTEYGEQFVVEKNNPFHLPTFEYGGYTYCVYEDLGEMSWSAANSACSNLVYVFDDWYLPNEEEMEALIKSGIIPEGKTTKYWTSSGFDSSRWSLVGGADMICWSSSYSGNIRIDNMPITNSYHVRPVRKYKNN